MEVNNRQLGNSGGTDEFPLDNVAVFCGSQSGTPPGFAEIAAEVGRTIVQRGGGVVYGGGKVGLMGVVADAALAAGGSVIGVLPRFLATREVAHDRLTRIEIVDTMHERKARMVDLSQAFVVLPGGLGTFDELCEILSWAQLGLHQKPIGILNHDGYFDPWLAQVERSIRDGFCYPEHRDLCVTDANIDRLLDRMAHYQPPSVAKWLHRDQV